MTIAVLGIGSNVADAVYRIKKSLELLSDSGCSILCCSDIYQVASPYFNLVAKVSVPMGYNDFLCLTKRLESQLGRLPHCKGDNLVPVDIDVVVFNGLTMRPADFEAPYFTRGYCSIT